MDEKLSREQNRVETYGGPIGRPIQSFLPFASKLSVEPGLSIRDRLGRSVIQG